MAATDVAKWDIFTGTVQRIHMCRRFHEVAPKARFEDDTRIVVAVVVEDAEPERNSLERTRQLKMMKHSQQSTMSGRREKMCG